MHKYAINELIIFNLFTEKKSGWNEKLKQRMHFSKSHNMPYSVIPKFCISLSKVFLLCFLKMFCKTNSFLKSKLIAKYNTAKRAWSLAKTECAICRCDASMRTETVELRASRSHVVASSRQRLANATHDSRNTSWLNVFRHRSEHVPCTFTDTDKHRQTDRQMDGQTDRDWWQNVSQYLTGCIHNQKSDQSNQRQVWKTKSW